MKRRTAIRTVVLLSAGGVLLNSCQQKASISLKSISLTGSEEDLLAQLTETIIPTTDFVGARELKSQEFVLVMTDECGNPEDQEKFMKGMRVFEDVCERKFDSKFTKCMPAQRAEFLNMLDRGPENKDVPEEAVHFYRSVKRFTIQSFTSSEQFLTQVRNYSLIPAPFKGCVPVSNA